MADVGSIFVKFGSDTSGFHKGNKEVQSGIEKTTRSTTAFNGVMKATAAGMATAFSVGTVIKFGEQAVESFDMAAKAQAKLLSALHGQVDVQQRLLGQSASLQSKSLFNDESIQDAQTFLATMGMSEVQISRIIPLIMDFATKFKTDLASSANIVSKAIGSSTNSLSRYGIEVEGAAGSSDRFNMAVAGLTKQVGGLATAATESGTSGLVQLRDTIDDIKELAGAAIWKNSGFSNFIQNLKELLQLKSGKLFEITSSDAETYGRQLVSQTKNIQEAKFALEGYLTQLKDQANEQGRLAKLDQEAADNAKILGIKSGILAGPLQDNADKHMATAKGLSDAYKKLLNTYRDFPEMMALIESGNKNLSKSEGDLTDSIEETGKIRVDTTLKTTTQLRSAIDELTKKQVGASFAQRDAIQAVIDKYQQWLSIAERQASGPNKMTKMTGKVDLVTGPDISAGKLAKPGAWLGIEPLKELEKQAIESKMAVVDLSNVVGGSAAGSFAKFSQSLADLGTGQITVKTFFSQMIGIVADFLSQLGQALIAAAIAAKAFKKLLVQPEVALIVGVGLVATAAVFSSIATKGLKGYADGGVFRSPTIGMFGEYPSARSNPEVAGKLSDLKQIFGGGSVNGKLYIEGRDLVYVLGQELNRQSRM